MNNIKPSYIRIMNSLYNLSLVTRFTLGDSSIQITYMSGYSNWIHKSDCGEVEFRKIVEAIGDIT